MMTLKVRGAERVKYSGFYRSCRRERVYSQIELCEAGGGFANIERSLAVERSELYCAATEENQ